MTDANSIRRSLNLAHHAKGPHMRTHDVSPPNADRTLGTPQDEELQERWRRTVRRRSLVHRLGLDGAVVTPNGGALLTDFAFADSGALTEGDVAILRFLAAFELIESDLWQQYNELGGVKGGNPAYIAALQNLDGDMPQYLAEITDDELSHAAFLNAYLRTKGARPVNLDGFRTLPSSKATGASETGRLTNLQSLDVDTSWYVRYRSPQNPDLGATFPQAVSINRQPAIPLNDNDTPPASPVPVPPANAQQTRMQAIANTAGFHFACIEQSGSSLYSIMALKATNLEVLRIIASIGGVESNHFSLWHDKAGNAVAQPLAGVTDPQTGVTFPNLNAEGGQLNQTNLVLPQPCTFLHGSLPPCSIVRPTLDLLGGAAATINSFTVGRLFEGQPPKFLKTIHKLAQEADSASRGSV
jgi:hypothetical protein